MLQEHLYILKHIQNHFKYNLKTVRKVTLSYHIFNIKKLKY
jgi:cytochrome c oxidase assembly protein Cox11